MSEKLYRAHRQILKILQQRGFEIPPEVLSRTLQDELQMLNGSPLQDLYSNFYTRLRPNNLIEYVYVGFKLIADKSKVLKDDILSFISMANAPLVTANYSSFASGHVQLPKGVNISPYQIPKVWNGDYLSYPHEHPIVAPCPRQVILVSNDIAPQANAEFRKFVNSNEVETGCIDIVQHFLIEELLYDAMEHTSQGEFYPLTVQEKAELLAEVGAAEDQLPIMLESDPIAKYLGLKKGTVLRTIQTFETIPSISPLEVEYRIVR